MFVCFLRKKWFYEKEKRQNRWGNKNLQINLWMTEIGYLRNKERGIEREKNGIH